MGLRGVLTLQYLGCKGARIDMRPKRSKVHDFLPVSRVEESQVFSSLET